MEKQPQEAAGVLLYRLRRYFEVFEVHLFQIIRFLAQVNDVTIICLCEDL